MSEWIPVSERLPDSPEQVLVFAMSTHYVIAQYKEIRTGVGEYEMAWVTSSAYDVPHRVRNVLAWIPLPEYGG